MEKHSKPSPDIPKWSALLFEAVKTPGMIMQAYSSFHNYSIGNQILALVQCQLRGLEPGPINTFPGWQALGRTVKRGERALVLCMPITRKVRDEEAQESAQENAEKGKSKVPSPYVFPSPRTEERLVEIKYSFARAVKQAKITDLRFHDLRHTAATRMGDAGADAFTLAAIFGWSDIRMAMRYPHAMEDAKRRAVEAIAVGVTRARRENAAIEISRDRSVTNEKRQAVGSP